MTRETFIDILHSNGYTLAQKPWCRGLETLYQKLGLTHSLAPLPEGESWHNPENLADSGDGWRWMTEKEFKSRKFTKSCQFFSGDKCWVSDCAGTNSTITYRIPASTPFLLPQRVPLTPEDFIGAWLCFGGNTFFAVNCIEHNDVHYKNSHITVENLATFPGALVRLQGESSFRPCYNEVTI